MNWTISGYLQYVLSYVCKNRQLENILKLFIVVLRYMITGKLTGKLSSMFDYFQFVLIPKPNVTIIYPMASIIWLTCNDGTVLMVNANTDALCYTDTFQPNPVRKNLYLIRSQVQQTWNELNWVQSKVASRHFSSNSFDIRSSEMYVKMNSTYSNMRPYASLSVFQSLWNDLLLISSGRAPWKSLV